MSFHKVKKKFSKSEIMLSEQGIMNLCCETLEQSKSQNWFLVRRQRISVSKNAHNIKCRNNIKVDIKK